MSGIGRVDTTIFKLTMSNTREHNYKVRERMFLMGVCMANILHFNGGVWITWPGGGGRCDSAT